LPYVLGSKIYKLVYCFWEGDISEHSLCGSSAVWLPAKDVDVHIKILEVETLQKPSLKTATFRALFRLLSDTIFYIGYIIAYFSPISQTLHDKLAKTIVVDV